MPVALLALAISAFGIGTTEFVIMGLLPEVATDLHVSIPVAGSLVSGYALGVVAGAPVLALAAARVNRRHALAGLMLLFVAGNLLCAVASNYPVLMTGRVVAALCHGAFFGIGSVLAADLVAPHRRASAIALMFSGLTLANVLGVPLGTALGQRFGWRSTFWAVTAIGLVSLVGLLLFVPGDTVSRRETLRAQLAPLRRVEVWLALATTVLGFGGLFASFTYVAPMMTEVAGFAPGTVTWLLVLFGAGLCIGNAVGGRLADRFPARSLLVLLALLCGVLVAYRFTVATQAGAAVTLFLVGVAGFATVPGLQMRVIEEAGGTTTLAAAVNIAAFNLGNAVGAYLGGVVIDARLGYAAPNLAGAVLAAGGLILCAVGVRRSARRRARNAAADPAARPRVAA
ncbi:DHA1 family inner membrane transport protein [Krasilnikovia cinnamomea]|uniref:DHA1 family inner membrane transport protein n=1 Tax=Krasilnikovia cinnamomea TaxID=349313 RepID=A0A4Q7ZT04_9ACTN|nr:MFS transporter [Krasilnikovia cinnamomea]RZU53783.1 DHA1 family inner membrane transport protein [Krasilnikovia cinnamomea]